MKITHKGHPYLAIAFKKRSFSQFCWAVVSDSLGPHGNHLLAYPFGIQCIKMWLYDKNDWKKCKQSSEGSFIFSWTSAGINSN